MTHALALFVHAVAGPWTAALSVPLLVAWVVALVTDGQPADDQPESWSNGLTREQPTQLEG